MPGKSEATGVPFGPWENILGASADWPKATLDFRSDNVVDLRAEIEMMGWTVEWFKTTQAYKLALQSGNYDWLKDLSEAPPKQLIAESDDSFLQKEIPKYAGGKTLEEKVAELGIKTQPRVLPRPASLDD